MKKRRSRWAALLSAVMLFSLLPHPSARAAADGTLGTISATVRLDYDQSLTELRERQVQVELLQGGTSLGTVDLTRAGAQRLAGGGNAQVTLRDASGGDLFGEWPGYLDVSVGSLPRGTYTLRFSGMGYTTCQETVVMDEYARHMIVGTGDAAFSLGDCNGDGRVDSRDREALAAALGSGERRDLEIFDLNGDGVIDIIDLAYVNRQITATGGAQLLETALLLPPVDTGAMTSELAALGVTVASGELESLFRADGGAVTFRPNAAGEIVLPFSFLRPTQLEQLKITSAAFAPILAGTVEVEDEQGRIHRYTFDNSLPAGIHALSLQEGSNVITIDLGSRIAVKKITVTVTKTETGFATVESIEFLKEMVPVDPSAASSQVTGLSAAAGNEQVSLRWNALPNISGYEVSWWPVSNPERVRTLFVETNQANITGLENLIAYQFTVTAVDGAWSGKPSAPVTATPQPASAPPAPDMVSVSALDGALRVSWKASKGATYYEVYYTSQTNAPASSYLRFGEAVTATGTTITGLVNDTAYSIYIIAGNDMGRSAPSLIASGTPKAVVYARPAGIPTQGVLEWQDFASIRLADPNNYKQDEYTAAAPFTPSNMADGDYRTHWTAKNWYSNEHVIVTFREPQDLSAAIWVPRLDGTYAGDLRAYSVQVWYAGEDTGKAGHLITAGEDRGGVGSDSDVLTWPAIRGNPAASKFAVMPFTPQRNVIQISVAAEQRAYTLVSLSELMFLKYDENHRLPDEIGELFADSLRTRLAPGVNQARIDQLRARLNSDEQNFYLEPEALADELALAEELLAGRTSSGVMVNGLDSRSGASEVNFGQGGSVLQPLGVAAAAGQEITIYAEGIPSGGQVTVYASQFNAEANAWQASMGTLENGRNVLTVPRIGSQQTPRGGSLYVTYSGSGASDIRLHIRRATDIPVLELSWWNAMSQADRTAAIDRYLTELDAYGPAQNASTAQTNWQNVTEIATPSVLLSLPAEAVRTGLKRADRAGQLADSIEAWEQIMQICRTVQGIEGTMQARQNIRCMRMFSGAFMYAAGSHIGIGYGSCSGMVGGVPVRGVTTEANHLFGWGIAHEIGHNMDKLGKAEITNNIYALAVQTFDGGSNILPSRLEKSGKYAAIFNKTAQSRPGASGDVFVQLGMYWQLHLAYDAGSAASPMDFYNRFFSAWKTGRYFGGATSYDDKVARTAAGVADRDLTEFFTHWGMELSTDTQSVLSRYPKEERAVWYLSDQSRRDRLQGGSRASGALTLSAAPAGENAVRLDFSASVTGGKVQGYEIFRNDKAIAFTTESTYTDTIGSGNNRTYTYTVVAYDTLGYAIDRKTTGEVRVAYDLLVDSGAYQITQGADGTVTIAMNQPTAVSGLRLSPTGGWNGACTVTITDQSGPHAVRTFIGEQGADRTIAYFQVAGDQTVNDRIGVYQPSTLVITGLPALSDLKNSLRLISYAGDDIAFLEGPTMGRLAEDYTYDTLTGKETVKAGTLVIAGTFQGDPMYNTVRITGEFAAPDMGDKNPDFGAQDSTQRNIPGSVLLFVQEQKDSLYGTVSGGIFLFIPDVQAEAALQEGQTSCGADFALPARIRAELWRTTKPDSTEVTRCTSQTLWIDSPGGDTLPLVELKGGGQ